MPLIEKIVKFSSSHRFISHVFFWMVVSVLFLNRYDVEDYDDPVKILIRHCYYISFNILASYFLAYLIIPRLIGSATYYSIILYFFAGSYIICVLSRLSIIYLVEPFTRDSPFGQESVVEVMADVPKLITHYFVLNFSTAWVFAFLKLIKDQYVVQQRSLILEKEKAETELKALKAQLNPHFLFNTLNNIYSLSLINSPVTSKSIAGLSEILDHVLYRCNANYVPVSAEITLINNYLELEKLRYDELVKIEFSHYVDADAEIAPLILLSLVENAFKHWAAEDSAQSMMAIELRLIENQFSFRVSNSFVSANERNEQNRIGLNNIRKQLELIYPGDHVFTISSRDGQFEVLLKINLRK